MIIGILGFNILDIFKNCSYLPIRFTDYLWINQRALNLFISMLLLNIFDIYTLR